MYESRESAGEVLAQKLSEFDIQKPFLIAIPRGGIQVAMGIADKIKIPIYTIITKKLPVPGSPETGFGAIAEDGTKVLNDEMVSYLNLSESQIEQISQKVLADIVHRVNVYGSINSELVKNKDVIVVDDGVATGYSLIVAVESVKTMLPNTITVAIPVSSAEAYEKIKKMVDRIVCPLVESIYFFAVGNYFKEWYDLPEDQIKNILDKYSEKYK